jgi:hypothetical protein
MSYDLFFKQRNAGPAPTTSDFAEYFSGRSNYESGEGQMIYQNEATGVYFIFDIGEQEDEEPGLLPVTFNLNYFRPHIFGLEAEPELTAFVRQFDLTVFDPQTDGMGDGEYSPEGFLRGWNTGNAFGYRSILQQNPNEKLLTLPTAWIEACWRWNLAKDELQNQFGEDVFVPRYLFLQREGRAVPTVVWPDGIPIAIPQAELVLIQRKDVLPKRFFRSVEDVVWADWETVREIVEQYPLEQGALPYRLLNYPSVPEEIVTWLKQLQPSNEEIEAIGTDKILNAELVQQILGQAN